MLFASSASNDCECTNTLAHNRPAALAAAAISTPFPAFDDSDVLTESDFNLFDANHTSQDAL